MNNVIAKEATSHLEDLAPSNNRPKNNKNKIIIIVASILLVIIIGLILFVIFSGEDEKKSDKKTSEVKSKTYFVYMDIVPAVKYEIVEKYTKCSTGKCLVEIMVKDYELLEEDVDGIFDDYKLGNKKELNTVLNEMLELSDDPDMDVDFYSNSDNIGDYLDLDYFSYGFYYDKDIDTVEEFYGRIMNDDVDLEDDTEDEINDKVITKQFLIAKPLIVIKNTKKGYNYNLTSKPSIRVSATGKLNDFKYFDYEVEFYVDAADLVIGKNTAQLIVANTDFEFLISPDEVEVVVSDKNSTTTSTTTKTTTSKKEDSTTTVKTTSRSDVEINLNDNVKYYKGTSCGGFQALKKSCFGKSMRELMAEYPDGYSDQLNDPDITEYMNLDSKVNDAWAIDSYVPGCRTTVSSSIQSKINSIPGVYGDFNAIGFMKPNWIFFTDSKYDKFKGETHNFEKYGLYDVTACGGGGDGSLTYYTLDEAACEKYNLPCGRW